MAVSFEVPLKHVSSSDFRLRNPQTPLTGASANIDLNVHFNDLKRGK